MGIQFFQGELTTSYGPLFAGYLIAGVPLLVLFVALAKNFLAGSRVVCPWAADPSDHDAALHNGGSAH